MFKTLLPRLALFASLALSSVLAVSSALAEETVTAQWGETQPVVVELFTSQGCNSCPPADMLLGKLSMRDDVLALAWHVDYWDYIGWKDPHADPGFTARQRGYARARNSRQVYTPQMVFNGGADAIGSRSREVMQRIAEVEEGQPGVNISVEGGEVALTGPTPSAQRTGVWLVSYEHEIETDVHRGENAGRRLVNYNVVRGLQYLGDWTGGEGRYALSENLLNSNLGLAVLVQPENGPIVGALKIRDQL